MADMVNFELVAPEKLLVSQQVEMVVVPGQEGDFGVLARHAPMISGVRPGVIEVHHGGKLQGRIFVAGGFAEVTPERLTVLAERAIPVGEIDRDEAEKELRHARDEYEGASSEFEQATATTKIRVAEAMLQAIASHQAH